MIASQTRDYVAETKEFLAHMDKQRSFVLKYREFKEKILHYFLYRLKGDRQVAEDLSCELFIKVYERFAQYDDRYAFSTWIYTIARNMLIDYFRSHAHSGTAQLEAAEHLSTDEEQFFDVMDRVQERKTLYEALNRLPPLQKEAVYRKHLLLQSTSEIAQSLGKNEPAVRQLVSRGCRTLLEFMSAVSPRDPHA